MGFFKGSQKTSRLLKACESRCLLIRKCLISKLSLENLHFLRKWSVNPLLLNAADEAENVLQQNRVQFELTFVESTKKENK